MQIATVNGKHLANGLAKVLKVRQPNAILPVLECVHVKTGKKMLVLSCTNLNDSITTAILADTKEVGKEFLIPPQATGILQHLKDEDIAIELTDILTFTFKDNVMKFPLIADEFPNLPSSETLVEFTVPADTRRLFETAKKLTSDDDLRPVMTGVQFTRLAGKPVTFVATDAHRLIEISQELDLDAGVPPFSVIVSKVCINALSAIDPTSELKFRIGAEHISVNDKATKVVSHLVCGNYPDYKVIIPKENTLHIEVDRLKLVGDIGHALAISTAADKRLNFTFDKEYYTLVGQDVDAENLIQLKGLCNWKQNLNAEDTFSISLNGNFLKQLLDILTGEFVTLEFNSPEKALVIHEATTLLLQMPLMNLK